MPPRVPAATGQRRAVLRRSEKGETLAPQTELSLAAAVSLLRSLEKYVKLLGSC